MASTEPFRVLLEHQRIAPLEPTHIVVEGEFEAVRSRVCEVINMFDGIEVDGVYESWLNNSLVHFRANILSSATNVFIVEFRKLRGDTVEFVNMFVSILRVFRHWAESSPPQLVVEATSAIRCWDWIREHSSNPNRFHSNSSLLLESIMDIDETLAPVIAAIRSEWYKSKMSGLESSCSLTEVETNATILSRHTTFLRALGTIDVTDRACPHIIRCLAKTVANMYCAPRPRHKEEAAALYMDILATRLTGLYASIKDLPSWRHSAVHIERIRGLSAIAGE